MMELTKERLQEIESVLSAGALGYSVERDEVLAMARQLLASMEQEPVAWLLSGGGAKNHVSFDSGNAYADPLREVTPLYAAPQLPQPAVAITQHFDTIALDTAKMVMCDVNRRGEFLGGDIQLLSRIQCRIDEAYRAAMLQGAEPVTTAYKLPDSTPCKDAPEHIWLQTAGVWPENGEFSELTWCSDNQHEDDTLYVRADIVGGNFTVTPDTWIPVSERMPEAEGRYWCYVEEQNCLGKSHYQWNCSWNGDRWWVESENGGRVTHWMPLPAAPQQEADNG